MASTYNLEPQPTAKVLLHTTSGDISLSLFAGQTPLASRNFLQHCLDGYYESTLFHRLVPDFILQGGDPTSLGTGGESSFENGAPFADEFHPRLRFNRRGLLGMANGGAKNDNGSQFFLTLGATPELDGKHTMFGRVEGDTIYNMVRMGEGEIVEGTDRPVYPARVTGAEVLVNPFEGMVARRKAVAEAKGGDDARGKKRKVAKGKGKGALSFGDDGEESMEVSVKRTKVNPSFGAAPIQAEKDEKIKARVNPDIAKVSTRKRSPSPESDTSEQQAPASAAGSGVNGRSPAETAATNAVMLEEDVEPEQVQKTMSALERTNAQIAALKQSMKRNTAAPQQVQEKKKSALESMIPATSTRGRKRGKRGGEDDDSAMGLFNAFRKKLNATTPARDEAHEHVNGKADKTTKDIDANAQNGGAADEEEKLCDLHFIANCQSCSSWADDEKANGGNADGDDDDPNWMSHQLSFAKDVLGKDLEWKRKMEEFEVIDPREKARDIAGGKKRERDKPDDHRSRHNDGERRRDRK